MLLPCPVPVGVVSLAPEPFLPQSWRVVFAQHVGQGRYQWLATSLVSGRTYAQARRAARAVASRLALHVQQHGVYAHVPGSPLFAPFVPTASFL